MKDQKASITLKFKEKEKKFYEKLFPGFLFEKHKILAMRVTRKKEMQLTLYAEDKSSEKTQNTLPIRTFRTKNMNDGDFFKEIRELHLTIEIKE
jgi:hypothetical protein